MLTYLIDPTELTPENPQFEILSALLELLITNLKQPMIVDGTYEMTTSEDSYEIELTHPLLVRPRKSSLDAQRIEVFHTTFLQEGSSGRIIQSLGVLIPEEQYRFKIKEPSKSRIGKLQVLADVDAIEHVENEHYFTEKITKLHCKSPVISQSISCIIMRKAKGEDLFQILSKLTKKELLLSIEQRLQLSHALLNAYKEQVYQLKIIHSDVKPEHIMVNLDQMDVTFIDYRYAVHSDNENGVVCRGGTPEYFSPETLIDLVVTPKSDIYALGLTIAQLWGDTVTERIETGLSFEQYYRFRNDNNFIGFFQNLEIKPELQSQITNLLNQLTSPIVDERISLDDAIEEMECIIEGCRTGLNPKEMIGFKSYLSELSHFKPVKSTETTNTTEDPMLRFFSMK